ncbi:pyrimidine-nucleoside phosphorylase [Geomicrobium sp. JSM 1781026]|uniref:pyrimidine-nucleoside phosphorylase n=1 Tax=Geomicrobium sp. JSM 1781026 TaxID=3344580 RepID=UPI0035C117EA
MRMVDFIAQKRDGGAHTDEEIKQFIREYTTDIIPDYQASAWAMSVYFQGMTKSESAALTMAMADSGDKLDLSNIEGKKVDKHSTGGVGDKTTFILSPLVAAAGVPVAKMSGRGLGHTGGTIDKLEAFPGFQTEMQVEDFIDTVNDHKLALVGQTGNLTPADKKLYALRDVTATVNAMPLIASSVMSKKIAAGADGIVLDVKVGSGAFMSDIEAARELASTMVDIGNELGRETVAVLSDMDQPLGEMVGNSLEVKEAIDVLKGGGPRDVRELSIRLAAHMLVLADRVKDVEEGEALAKDLIHSGKALQAFKEFVVRQGGQGELVDQPEDFLTAKHVIEVVAQSSGYVKQMNAAKIGQAAGHLGAGRMKKDDPIDHSVGVQVKKKRGDYVEKGEALVYLHSNTEDVASVKALIQESYEMTEQRVEARPLILDEM